MTRENTSRARSFAEVTMQGAYAEDSSITDDVAELSFHLKIFMGATFGLIAVGVLRMAVLGGVPLI